jgi:hypothetical protein
LLLVKLFDPIADGSMTVKETDTENAEDDGALLSGLFSGRLSLKPCLKLKRGSDSLAFSTDG